MRVLLVADLQCFKLRELAATLTRRGAVTFSIPPARLDRAAMHEADVILLDPGLPHHESIAICHEVRAMSDTPLIVISDRTERADHIRGLQAGADDFVTFPYDFRELITRVIAATRPRGRTRDEASRRLSYDYVGDMHIDLERMRVTVAGATIELTKKEFQMLALIASEDGAVCSREKLAREVWGRPEGEVSDSIQVLMSRLRAKVGQARIKTVRSVGYQLIV
jgi:DNA-binding response OmpR family regulator